MKFLRESISKSIYDDFFHNIISELEDITLMFSSFHPFVCLTIKATDVRLKQFQCSNIVFCNKTKPLFVGLQYVNVKLF